MEQTPGIADVRLGREDGRPELALRVDRDKAAMLGLTVSEVATTIRTNIAGTQAAFYRERGLEYPIIVRLRQEDRQRIDNVNDVLVSTPAGRAGPGQEPDARRHESRPGRDRAQEPGARHPRQRRARRHARATPSTRCRRGCPSCACRATSRSASAPRSRSRPRPSRQLQLLLLLAVDPRLRGDGVAVRVAARPVHHHVLDPAGRRSASCWRSS